MSALTAHIFQFHHTHFNFTTRISTSKRVRLCPCPAHQVMCDQRTPAVSQFTQRQSLHAQCRVLKASCKSMVLCIMVYGLRLRESLGVRVNICLCRTPRWFHTIEDNGFSSLLRSFHLSVPPQPLPMRLLLHMRVQTTSHIL